MAKNELKRIGKEVKNKSQLDVTYYFIVRLLGSTCFGHYYAHHQELATIMPGHYSSLTAPNLQPTANQEQMTNVVINIIVASS